MPAGSFVTETNDTRVNFPTNLVVGDFFILPSNICAVAILVAQLTNVIPVTNILVSATNANPVTNSNAVLSYTQSEIDYFTNHVFIIYPVTCPADTIALRQGIE